jgi:hypothetical protein
MTINNFVALQNRVEKKPGCSISSNFLTKISYDLNKKGGVIWPAALSTVSKRSYEEKENVVFFRKGSDKGKGDGKGGRKEAYLKPEG